MTNKEWLATLSPQEWYIAVHWLFHEYGKRFDDTYLAVIAWLEEKHTECDLRATIVNESRWNDADG